MQVSSFSSSFFLLANSAAQRKQLFGPPTIFLNAPSFIHWLITRNEKKLQGVTEAHHQEKTVLIRTPRPALLTCDHAIPTEAMLKLNKAPHCDLIEIRSTCQGESVEKPSFLVFRIKDRFKEMNLHYQFCEYFRELADDFEKKNSTMGLKFFVGLTAGTEGNYRIGVASNTFFHETNLKDSDFKTPEEKEKKVNEQKEKNVKFYAFWNELPILMAKAFEKISAEEKKQ